MVVVNVDFIEFPALAVVEDHFPTVGEADRAAKETWTIDINSGGDIFLGEDDGSRIVRFEILGILIGTGDNKIVAVQLDRIRS
jgi:hypothetical protein